MGSGVMAAGSVRAHSEQRPQWSEGCQAAGTARNTSASLHVWFGINFWLLSIQKSFNPGKLLRNASSCATLCPHLSAHIKLDFCSSERSRPGLLKQPGSAYGITLKHCCVRGFVGRWVLWSLSSSATAEYPRHYSHHQLTFKDCSGRSAAAAQRRLQGESLSGLLLSPSSVHTGEQPCLREPQFSLKPSSLHSLCWGTKKILH